MAELSLESRTFLDEVVAAGRFESREAALDEAVRRLREELETDGHDQLSKLSASEWCERFERWAASHRTLPYEADDSRESIYAGRGE